MRSKTLAAVVATVCFIYLLNPTLGIFELLPDNIPGFGNLDEGAAGALLLWAITVLRNKGALPIKQAQVDEHPDRS